MSAAALAGNASMRAGVRAASEAGMPIYAECGGFMYLCAELGDLSGARAPMAGCFPFATRMLPRLKSLGYREVRLTRDTLLGPVGTVLRGHEFHYSEMESHPGPVDSVYAADGAGRIGPRRAGVPRPPHAGKLRPPALRQRARRGGRVRRRLPGLSAGKEVP